MKWDDLSDDFVSDIKDAQDELDHLSHYLDEDDDTLEMPDVREYLACAVKWAQSAIDAIDKEPA